MLVSDAQGPLWVEISLLPLLLDHVVAAQRVRCPCPVLTGWSNQAGK